MTRTEDDLRSLLHSPVGSDASARVLGHVVSGARERSSERVWRIGLVAALAVVVVVGAVLAVVAARVDRPSVTPAVSVSPSAIPLDALIIGVDAGSGFRVGGVTLDHDGQSAVVTGADPQDFAMVSLAPVGGSPGTPVPGRGFVTVGDAVAHWYSPYRPPESRGPAQADVLRWESGGFAFSAQGSPYGDGDTTALAAAHALRVVAPVPVRVPVAVSAWPEGLMLEGISTDNSFVTVNASPHVDVRVFGPDVKGVDPERGDPVLINGRTWRWDASIGVLSWFGSDRIVQIGPETYSESQFVSRSTVEALAAALTFAPSFADESTWFDATAALPSR